MTTVNATWTSSTSGLWTTASNWNTTIPGVSGTLVNYDFATFGATGTYTVTVGTASAWSLGSVYLTAPGATLNVASGGLVTSYGVIVSAGTLLLAGMLTGGTLTLSGGTLAIAPGSYSAALNGVKVAGTLNLSAPAIRLTLEGPNTFAAANGSGAGSILLTGASTTLAVGDTETLANVGMVFGAAGGTATLQLSSYFGQSLTFASTAAITITGRALISNIVQSTTKQVLNSGAVTVTSGATLEIGPAIQLAEAAGGTLAIQSGGTLQLDDAYTTAALQALVSANVGTIEIDGTLDNSGNTLTLAPGSRTPALVLRGATLRGGTVALAGGSLTLLSGGSAYTPIASTLDGVTIRGALSLAAAAPYNGYTTPQTQTFIRDGLTLQGTSGTGNGAILLTGTGQALLAADTDTISSASITLGNATSYAILGATAGNTLKLAANTQTTVAGLAQIGGGGTFLNAGAITVQSGAWLDIAAGTQLGLSTGTLALAAGSTLELDGVVTTPQLRSLVTAGSGTVEVDGTLDNTGQTTVLAQGGIPNLLLRGGTLRGGTLALTSGALAFAAATGANPILDGLHILGTLDLSRGLPGPAGAYLGLRGNVTFAAADGVNPGTLLASGPGSELRALDSELLQNVAITFGNAAVASVLGTTTGNTLTLGASATLAVTGRATINGAGAFTNQGAITLAAGARLDIAAALGASSGTIALATGSTLALDGGTNTAALLALNPTGPGTIAVDGTLNNTGATLDLAPNAAIAQLSLEGGTLRGGILRLDGGALLFRAGLAGSSPTLDGVLVQGPIDLSHAQPGAALWLRNGVAVQSLSGSAGQILLTGAGQSIAVQDTDTLDAVAITLGGGDHVTEAAGQVLTLGMAATLDVTGSAWLTGGYVQNAGRITVESNQTLHLDGGFTNFGQITVNYGGRILVGGNTTLAAFAALEASAAGAGSIGLDAGAILDLGSGALRLAPGTPLAGTILNGTIQSAQPTPVTSLTLDAVTWQGTLAPTGKGSLTLLDGTAVTTAAGAPGLLDATGFTGPLTISGSFDRGELDLGGGSLQSGPAGLALGGASTLDLTTSATVTGTITGAGTLNATGQVNLAASFANSGTMQLNSAIVVAADLTNSGTIVLDSATLALAGPAILGGTVAFGTGANRLSFGAAGYDSATLAGFRYGDVIDLGGLAYGPSLALSLQGNTISVATAAITVASFTLPDGGTSAGQFSLFADGAGGTLLTTNYRATAPVTSGPGTDFDAAWYLVQHPDVAASGSDPLTHYLNIGWQEGYDPNPWFNTTYYLNQNADIARAGVNPLLHYELSGWKEGRDPSALFSTRGYLAANPDVAAANMDPLQHFLANGQYEGRPPVAVVPHPVGAQDLGVSNAWYLAQHPDVAASGLDPSAHYNTVGWKLGYNPNPLFDTKFYLTENPDVAAAGVDPLTHFEVSGWKEGREPSLAFNDQQYLAAQPDVAAAGVNPLLHYLLNGQFEGRADPVNGPVAATLPDPLVNRAFYFAQFATIVPASLDAGASYHQAGWHQGLNPDAVFDTSYYLAQNADIVRAGVDPLLHFEVNGWKEGRNPSASFSLNKYEAAYGSIIGPQVNPLVDYLTVGQAAGRQAFAV